MCKEALKAKLAARGKSFDPRKSRYRTYTISEVIGSTSDQPKCNEDGKKIVRGNPLTPLTPSTGSEKKRLQKVRPYLHKVSEL